MILNSQYAQAIWQGAIAIRESRHRLRARYQTKIGGAKQQSYDCQKKFQITKHVFDTTESSGRVGGSMTAVRLLLLWGGLRASSIKVERVDIGLVFVYVNAFHGRLTVVFENASA